MSPQCMEDQAASDAGEGGTGAGTATGCSLPMVLPALPEALFDARPIREALESVRAAVLGFDSRLREGQVSTMSFREQLRAQEGRLTRLEGVVAEQQTRIDTAATHRAAEEAAAEADRAATAEGAVRADDTAAQEAPPGQEAAPEDGRVDADPATLEDLRGALAQKVDKADVEKLAVSVQESLQRLRHDVGEALARSGPADGGATEAQYWRLRAQVAIMETELEGVKRKIANMIAFPGLFPPVMPASPGDVASSTLAAAAAAVSQAASSPASVSPAASGNVTPESSQHRGDGKPPDLVAAYRSRREVDKLSSGYGGSRPPIPGRVAAGGGRGAVQAYREALLIRKNF